jgi:hypothetical protein
VALLGFQPGVRLLQTFSAAHNEGVQFLGQSRIGEGFQDHLHADSSRITESNHQAVGSVRGGLREGHAALVAPGVIALWVGNGVAEGLD